MVVVVGGNVLHHVKGRGNCPGGEMSGGHFQEEYVQEKHSDPGVPTLAAFPLFSVPVPVPAVKQSPNPASESRGAP